MQAVILAGGLGTRISEETDSKPKPMIEIGGMPILWHIMKIYSEYGVNDFIICCGYKGHVIKKYFSDYYIYSSDLTIHTSNNQIEFHNRNIETWKITLVDTGLDTMTGGRLKRVAEYLDDEFCFTYGDGVANVDIKKLISQHKESNLLATLTATQPPGRFGALNIKGNKIKSFHEKPDGDNAWVNGGFFVLNKKVIELIDNDNTTWEQEPLQRLTEMRQLGVYKHHDFWQPMDTLRDKNYLEDLWKIKSAPWKIWD